jgi:small subunit ribosomal protein S11
MKNKIVTLAVKCTANNTIIHARGLNKNIILSTGNVGFKGAKRSTKYATEQLAQVMSEKLIENKIKNIIIIFKGSNKGKKSIIKKLKKTIVITKLIDKTPVSHNGCRAKKKRRL